jgi:hypothetical protein
MRRAPSVVALLVSTILGASALGAQPAAAAAGITLPFDSFFRMAVDEETGTTFVSGGTGTHQLAVFDATGASTGTIPTGGASGLAIAGRELFVAEADTQQLSVVDLDSTPPAVTSTIDLAPFTGLADLTFVNGRLWFFADQGLGSVRLDGGGVRGPYQIDFPSYGLETARFVDGLAGATELMFFSMQWGDFRRYDATPRLRQIWSTDPSSRPGQFALAPGRASVLAPGPEYRLADSALLRQYTAPQYADAVAVTSAHGGMAAMGVSKNSVYDLYAYRLGYAPSFFQMDVGDTDQWIVPAGLAWSPDGSDVLAVTVDGNGTQAFHVVPIADAPDVSPSVLAITPSLSPTIFGEPTDIAIHLEGPDAGQTVKLFSQPTQAGRTFIGSAATDADGNVTIPLDPPGSTMLTAAFAGNAEWSMATAGLELFMRSTTRAHLFGKHEIEGIYTIFRNPQGDGVRSWRAPQAEWAPAKIVVQSNDGAGWTVVWSEEGSHYYGTDATKFGIPSLPPTVNYRLRVISESTVFSLLSASPWLHFRYA